MDNGPSLISSITLPPSSPSPSFSDSTPGGGSLLNGPHSFSQASEGLKVSHTNEVKFEHVTLASLAWSMDELADLNQLKQAPFVEEKTSEAKISDWGHAHNIFYTGIPYLMALLLFTIHK